MPAVEKIGNKLFNTSCLFMRWLDPAMDCLIKNYMDFLPRNHYCHVKIITQGVPTECKKKSIDMKKQKQAQNTDRKRSVTSSQKTPKLTQTIPKKQWTETSDGLVECLGWASTDHINGNDKLRPETQLRITSSLQAWLPLNDHEKTVKTYLQKFDSQLGF